MYGNVFLFVGTNGPVPDLISVECKQVMSLAQFRDVKENDS